MYDDLAIFVNIVKLGSFVDAAKLLGISPATLTRRIQSLEKKLNFIILKRDTRTLELSRAGQQLYDKFSSFELDLADTISSIEESNNTIGGQINVLLPPFFALSIITPYLAEFVARYPRIVLNITYQNRNVNLIKDNFDLAIINHRPQKSSQKIRLLCRSKIIFYCYPAYLEKHSLPVTHKEVEEALILGIIFDQGTITKPFYLINRKTQKKKLFNFKHRIIQNSGAHDKKIAQCGPVLGIGADVILKSELASGALIHVLPDYYVPGFDYYLLINPEGKNARINTFIHFINECMERLNLDENLSLG